MPINDYNTSAALNTTLGTIPVGPGMAREKVNDAIQQLMADTAALPASGGAALVGFQQAGTGAVARTAQAKMRDFVSVKDFGAVGDGVANDTAAIQAAINSGKPIIFPAGDYLSGPLTQSTNFQRFYADGHVNIIKNANGVLFTSSGNYIEVHGLQFVGTGFTGNNIESTGNSPRFINCSSYGTPGRALKATGSQVQILGTCGSFTTTDATASGYDIEIGVSGTATLYHQLTGIYTSQATGGILLIDTGSHVISGGQFGKLTIQSGTSPGGVNGGITSNARILGNVLVQLSNSIFTGNQFSAVTITFALGTSLHSIDASNNLSGATIVNNGNDNSLIVKSIGTGSPVGTILQYGSDAFNSTVRYSNNEIYFQDADLFLANNKALRFIDSGGTSHPGVTISSSDDWTFGAGNGSNFANFASGSGGVYTVVDGTTIAQFYSGGLRPQADGSSNLGTAGQRWATVFATTGTINTSDGREKQQIRDIDATEKLVAARCKKIIKAYKWNEAVASKGDDARVHFGVIAQEVEQAFAAEGLDAHNYGLFCYDEWEAQDEHIDAETGAVIHPGIEAGNRYGIRLDELLIFIVAAL